MNSVVSSNVNSKEMKAYTTPVYNSKRKNLFKLKLKFRETWQQSSLNRLVDKSLNLAGEWKKSHEHLEGRKNSQTHIKVNWINMLKKQYAKKLKIKKLKIT